MGAGTTKEGEGGGVVPTCRLTTVQVAIVVVCHDVYRIVIILT